MEWHVEDCNYKIVVFFFCETPPQVAIFLRDNFIHSFISCLAKGGGGGWGEKGAYASNFFMILFHLFFYFFFYFLLFFLT